MWRLALPLGAGGCVFLASALVSGGCVFRRVGSPPSHPLLRFALPPRAMSAAERRRACLDELPVMLDVLTLGLSAGLSFDASLELYCERYGNELARALDESMLAWRIGARPREAELMRLAEELGLPAFRRFASMVGEALTFGTPLAEALEHQGEAIREEQRSQIEEEIERVPVKMLVPLGTLIVPAMLVAILGPLLGQAVLIG